MVERYLHRGEIFIAFERGDCACASPAAPCFASAGEDDPDVSVRPEEALGCMVVTDEGFDERGHRVAEVKSLAVLPASRRRSAGRALDFAAARYSSTHDVCRLERVDSPLIVPFNEACGFVRSHMLSNFFIDQLRPSDF